MADKVTAGEWVASGDGIGLVKAMDGEDFDYIADCDCGDINDGYLPTQQITANTRLMAASKRMYRMLKQIREEVSMKDWREQAIDELFKEINVEVD